MGVLQDFFPGPLLTTFLLGFTTLVLMLWYTYWKQSYWKRIGIPYATRSPLLGSLADTIFKPFHEVEIERFKKYGRIYGHYEGNRPILSVADTELLRNILVKDFHAFPQRRPLDVNDKVMRDNVSVLKGEDWKRVRTLITPTFTTGKIKRLMGIFKECSQTLMKNFRKAADEGRPIDIRQYYGAFVMDVIASSAFSTKIDSCNDPNNKFVKNAQLIFVRGFNWRFLAFFLIPNVMKFFGVNLFSGKPMEFFSDVTLQIIEERTKSGQRRNDFLQLLMDCTEELSDESKTDLHEKDDILENYGSDENKEIFKTTDLTKKTLSHDELIAQCVIFFIAGYDTTSNTLAFASYLLALHPEIQEKLIEELDDTLREYNGELTYDAIQSMKYLDNVISETMRLYSPAVRIERQAEENYKLGDTGLVVPKGMLISIPVYALHRDPEVFPDPEKFDPDRFTQEERSKRSPYAYLPFGAGPRNCIGMRFVLVELKVCLAHVLSNFRIKTCPETKVPLQFHNGQGILNPKDVTLSLVTRNDTVKAM